MITRTRKTGSIPALPKHPGNLNDSRCNSSSTEVGVLVPHHRAAARPLPKEVRTITVGGDKKSLCYLKNFPFHFFNPTYNILTGEFGRNVPEGHRKTIS
ncbi:hypothetical protein AVEN_172995-1 [Araneus ventricosus]|uniref:Uncharacterized protein n=1 Tax=Araneus ventricosus TaxID=182803 RepID=A0A4Y2BA59_ARAVE|nr:hypothetical protein AVEN_172995-1 [Araneus ventricosus]